MLITTVRIDQVRTHPHNIRRDVGDVTELADSFRTSGLVQPIVIAPAQRDTHVKKAKTPPYTLIAGHRRFAAAKACGWKEIDAIVRDDLDTEAKQIETMAIENLQRTNLTPVEEAHAYQELLDLGYTPAKIAKSTGRNVKTVKLRIGLNKLSDNASDKLHAGQITIEQAEVLASFAKTPKSYAALEKSIGTPNFAYEVQRIKEQQRKEAERSKLVDQLEKDGVTYIKPPARYPWDSVAKPLRELGIAVDAHGDCPGHAATVVDAYPSVRLEYVCTDPVANGHSETTSVGRAASQVPDPEALAARQQRSDDLRTAQVTRREFVKDLLKRQRLTPTVECQLLRSVLIRRVEELLYNDSGAELAELLRLDPQIWTDEDKDQTELLNEFRCYLRTRIDVTDLLQVLLAVHVLDADPLFSFDDDYVPAYLATLTEAGYELSDVERAELARTHPSPERDVEDVEPAGDMAAAL